jgi:hypothetical protein
MISRSYIYTNWRGKSFIIDERFAAEFRKYMVEDGISTEDVQYITPEYLIEVLPDIERWQRHFDLEGMWHQLGTASTITSET